MFEKTGYKADGGQILKSHSVFIMFSVYAIGIVYVNIKVLRHLFFVPSICFLIIRSYIASVW